MPAHRNRTAQPRRFSPLRLLWRLLLAFVKLVLLAVLLLMLVVVWLYHEYGKDLPAPQEIGQHRSLETTRIYARDGKTLLYELVDPEGGRRTVVPFDRIPHIVKDATIAVEDAGFYHHPGVDWRGIVRAMWLNYTHQEIVSGGSTIPQQLVRNILLTPSARAPDVAEHIRYERKLREAILAYRVSREYSKDQILSLYLNEVYYGAQAYGVEAAAQTYFGKHVWELTSGEATLIAGLPQSPTRLDPFENMDGARARQRITLDLMVKYHYLTPHEADAIYNEPITLVPPETRIVAPHFVFYVRNQLEQRYGPDLLYRGGLRVTTSIDLALQAEAERIANAHIDQLRARNAHNAAAVILAPDGQVLAMVGSIDYHNPVIDGNVNVTLAPRQPGSALKPIVYAAALQKGWTPATVIWDVPTAFPASNGTTYEPMNYDNSWHGPLRLRMALANSLNIPAVKTLEFVGIEEFVQLATRMGITTFDDTSRYGLSMALGSAEVRLLDLTGAYNTLNNGGHATPPVGILKVANRRGETLEEWTPQPGAQVFTHHGREIAYLITDILSDNQARWYMFGRGNVMELPDGRPAAVKTGTSNEWRDSWAVGYTPNVTIGVWVGNNDNAPMQEVAGANGAGQIWQDLMRHYHQGREPHPFTPPAGIVEQTICADTGASASDACPRTITERFVAGTAPQKADVTRQTVRLGGDGTCLAASYTPPHQVRVVTFVVYPPEFRDWAINNGIPQPPTEYCPPPETPGYEIARLFPLSRTATISGSQVFINGTARGPYVLEVGAGAEPAEWSLINNEPIAKYGGMLGVWKTRGIPAGQYTLRLTVTTPEGIVARATQVVTYTERRQAPPEPSAPPRPEEEQNSRPSSPE